MSLGENSLVAAYQGRGQLKSRPSGTRVVTNAILYNKQFGFRKNHSTTHAIIEVVDKITEALDQQKITIGVFLDLSKAFDMIHSFILAISIAPLQVLYYSEALPTTARILYLSFTPKRTSMISYLKN